MKSNLPLFDSVVYSGMGFTCLSDNVSIGDETCEIWARVSLSGESVWEYLTLVCDLEKAGDRHVITPLNHKVEGLNFHMDSPSLLYCVGLLKAANIVNATPPFAYEWAININDCNDFNSNFPSKELRDRAVDELVLHPDFDDDASICLFEIFPNGTQSNAAYASRKSWIVNRKLQDFVLTAGQPLAPAEGRQ